MSKRKLEEVCPDQDEKETKRRRIDASNNFESLPDSVITSILSNFAHEEDEYQDRPSLDVTELRCICRQFCRAINDVDPVFAFMKMITEEHRRVQESGGTIQSQWFTEYELKLIMTSHGLDMREPFPAPELIPLTALQIIASTLYCASITDWYWDGIIYSVPKTMVYKQKVNNKNSKFYGMDVIWQHSIGDLDEDACACCTNLPEAYTLFAPDPELARHLGGEAYSPITTRLEWDLFDYDEKGQPPPPVWLYNSGDTKESDFGTIYPLNLDYEPSKQLFDRLPKLGSALYNLLTNRSQQKASTFRRLSKVITLVKKNMIFKFQNRLLVEQQFHGSIVLHNLSQAINLLTISGLKSFNLYNKDNTNYHLDNGHIHRTNLTGSPKQQNFLDLLNLQETYAFPVIITPSDLKSIFCKQFKYERARDLQYNVASN
eukprot:TRINITY_DN7181_c0_g1_i1.p1 TRINITY_DN7181_c0_g1~~TRINITY_DN7181_c0_g1_i1.p1  ORF type:complete len:431 (-),score=16.39 TRINITY_DN7181_c0_g1_i1:109-1401(-)